MKTTDQTITTEIQNLNEVLRMQRMVAKDFRNPEVNFVNPQMFSVKLDSSFFFTMKMNDEKQYLIDSVYYGEDKVDPIHDNEWMSLMELLTEIDSIRDRVSNNG